MYNKQTKPDNQSIIFTADTIVGDILNEYKQIQLLQQEINRYSKIKLKAKKDQVSWIRFLLLTLFFLSLFIILYVVITNPHLWTHIVILGTVSVVISFAINILYYFIIKSRCKKYSSIAFDKLLYMVGSYKIIKNILNSDEGKLLQEVLPRQYFYPIAIDYIIKEIKSGHSATVDEAIKSFREYLSAIHTDEEMDRFIEQQVLCREFWDKYDLYTDDYHIDPQNKDV